MMAIPKDFMRVVLALLALLACLLLPSVGHAYSAVAWVEGRAVTTTYAGWNFPTQKLADATALNGCRTAAKEARLTKLETNCKVLHRQKGPGAGAIVCGKTGCSVSSGFDTEQDAMGRSYQQCEEKKLCRVPKIRNDTLVGRCRIPEANRAQCCADQSLRAAARPGGAVDVSMQ